MSRGCIAHFCGVYGHKPTFGLVPRQGHIPPPPGNPARGDLWVVDPLARSADDLALAMDVLTRVAPGTGTSGQLTMRPQQRRRLPDYRVAAWLDDGLWTVDDEIRAPSEHTIKTLREAGVAVNETARPGFALYGGWGLHAAAGVLNMGAATDDQRKGVLICVLPITWALYQQ